MAAKTGNKNAAKQDKRIDVHVSISNTRAAKRRSILERYMRSQGVDDFTEQDIVQVCRQRLYDWIDGLDV